MDPGDSLLLRFAADLRELRKTAGGLGYRELGSRAHYSAGVLSEAAGGRKLPSLAVTLAYVQACGGDTTEWERRWHEVAADLRGHAESAEHDQAAPYIGLRAFQTRDADRFFGRQRLVEQLSTRVLDNRFVTVVGASGAGKTSLLRAGLVPAIGQHTSASGQPWPTMVMTPGPHPLEECAIRLAGLTGNTPSQLVAEFATESRALHRLVRQALNEHPDHVDAVLVIDQFEEIFTLCHEAEERTQFIDALTTAAGADTSRLRVVLGIRADFYGHCSHYPELVEVLQRAQVLIGPMTRPELREAISRPAVQAGCSVEGALLATLCAEAEGRTGVLPLLSHVLREAWGRRRGNALTLSGYQAAGGIEGAIARTAESTYTALTDEQQLWARQLFLRLVALGDGTEDTKRHLVRTELDLAHPDSHTVLEQFVRARLVTVDHHSVQIAHEALIRHWPRLHDWLTQDRDGLRIHRQLADATAAWESLHRDPEALYRGARLAAALDWVTRSADSLTRRERAFLDASKAAQAAEYSAARRRTRRLRQLVALLTVLLVLATFATILAKRAQDSATEQRNVALSQKVAGQATAIRPANPALAAQLSLAAYRLAPTVEARSSLFNSFATPYATTITNHHDDVDSVALGHGGRLLATSGKDRTVRLWDVSTAQRPRDLATITAHQDTVHFVAFGPDGYLLATASWDGTARLWDTTDPRQPRPLATVHSNAPVNTVAISADGNLLAGASGTGVALWDITDRTNPVALPVVAGHTDKVNAVAFSHTGRTLASVSSDHTVRLLDATNPREPRLMAKLDNHTDVITAVAFRPDDTMLATGSDDRTARLWSLTDLSHPTEVASLTSPYCTHIRTNPRQPLEMATVANPSCERIISVGFSPDGSRLVTGGLDRTARLWDITEPGQTSEVMVLAGHTGPVASVAFTPDATTLVTSGDDNTVRIWDIPGPVLRGHSNAVYGTAFSQDDRLAATASYDHSTRLWDTTDLHHPKQLALLGGHTGPVNAVAFSPHGNLLATASYDRTARLWDISNPRQPRELAILKGHTDAVNAALVFSPDGRFLVTGSADRTTRIWDITDPQNPPPPTVLTGHISNVEGAALSPNGRILATASNDRTTRLWDLTNPRQPRELATLTGYSSTVKTVAFHPDGKVLATGGSDGHTQLWDITEPESPSKLATLPNHTNAVYSVAFSPDGRTLASQNSNTTTLLTDVTNPRQPVELATLTGHGERVYQVAFTHRGTVLATASQDYTTRFWETDPARIATRICDRAATGISETDWQQYFPNLPYQPPCP